MYKFVLLGSGGAPGVPSISNGWGNCNPANPKNTRLRSSAFLEYDGTAVLIDTSPDLRAQLLRADIRRADAVLYTHAHADHLHGIDDLREINRITGKSLDFYAAPDTAKVIKDRFPYLISAGYDCTHPNLTPHEVLCNRSFTVGKLKITPICLQGHNIPSVGYVFNDGDVVYLSDYRHIDKSAMSQITRPVKLMVLPLTTVEGTKHHAGLTDVLADISALRPERAVLGHMASECDYDEVMRLTPANVEPGFDNMTIEF